MVGVGRCDCGRIHCAQPVDPFQIRRSGSSPLSLPSGPQAVLRVAWSPSVSRTSPGHRPPWQTSRYFTTPGYVAHQCFRPGGTGLPSRSSPPGRSWPVAPRGFRSPLSRLALTTRTPFGVWRIGSVGVPFRGRLPFSANPLISTLPVSSGLTSETFASCGA